jgi:hypothetical protein
MEQIKILQFKEKMKLFGYATRTLNDSEATLKQFFKYLEEKENLTSIEQLKPEHVRELFKGQIGLPRPDMLRL